MFIRTLLRALAIGVVVVACVPEPSRSPSTTVVAPTTTVADNTATTTTTTTIPPAAFEPPERGDTNDVASGAIWDAGDFELTGKPTLFEVDALETVERWLPEDLVDGLVWEVYTNEDDTNVLAMSVIPTLTWRGDPNFVPALIASLTGIDPEEVSEGIFRTETTGGLVLYAWSTGDGFIISTSVVPGTAITYLEALAAESTPREVWETGACLYIDPETETLPYAPFPPDIVVPCEGAHNAEVLISRQVGTSLAEYDSEAIEYDRNYECDMAYAEVFGSQKTHKPMLITYMPDEDEWNRGDRYLACVVQLEGAEGIELIEGPMADRPDLVWNPEPGSCFDRSFAPETVACNSVHGYQYLGDTDVSFSEWPTDAPAAFTEACADLLDEFVRQGPATVDVFATGLFPYAFEQGDRSVRCMAFALEDGLLVDVAGSFDEIWRVVASGGVAA